MERMRRFGSGKRLESILTCAVFLGKTGTGLKLEEFGEQEKRKDVKNYLQ